MANGIKASSNLQTSSSCLEERLLPKEQIKLGILLLMGVSIQKIPPSSSSSSISELIRSFMKENSTKKRSRSKVTGVLKSETNKEVSG